MDLFSFTTISVGADGNGDGVPDNDTDGNANTVTKADAVTTTTIDLERVIVVEGNGDASLDVGETGYIVSHRGAGNRATTVPTDNTPIDPVLIRAHGQTGGGGFGDLSAGLRFSKTAGFGLQNSGDNETTAKVLNNGDALTFEMTNGRMLRAVEFMVDTVGGAAVVALDVDDESVTDGESFSLGSLSDLSVVRIDFVAQTITVNGAAVIAPSGFFAAFAAGGQNKLTIGTPTGDPGFALKNLQLAAEAPANGAPTADDDTYNASEDTPLSVAAAGVLEGDLDPDGNALTTLLVTGPAHGSLTLNADGSFVYTPDANYHGPDSFTYRAVDAFGAQSNIATVSIVVASVDDAPVVVAPLSDQSAIADTPFSFTVPVGTFADADVGDTLTLGAALADGAPLPDWLSFDPVTGVFSGTPEVGDAGEIDVRVTATDETNLFVSDDFRLLISASNAPPIVVNPLTDQAVDEDAPFSFIVPADAFEDGNGDALSFSAELADGGALPSWLSFDSATRTFSGSPANGDVGVLAVRVIAADPFGGSVGDVFEITITNTNDAPTIAAPIVDQNATATEAFSFALPAGVFADVDVGDVLSFSATLLGGGALPSWLSFDAATGLFSGTPAEADIGVLSISVTATDIEGANVTDTFDINVLTFNNAPTLTAPLADVGARTGEAFFLKLPPGAFTDVDGDALTLSATLADGSALPDWLVFDHATGRFAGLAEGASPLAVTITATDARGLSASDTFDINFSAGRIFDARDYGAVANDAGDDSAAIQQAINAANAAGGGAVVLGPGTFLVSGTSDKSDGALRLLENTTLKGSGLGETIIKVKDGWNGDITGVIRTPYNQETDNVGLFDLTIDGNRENTTGKIDGFYSGVAPSDPRASDNTIVQRVELKNNSGYGFDPHEQTHGLFVLDNVSHHNTLDGFVADYIVESLYRGNVAYANDRHGFNVTTSSFDLRLVDNIAYGNGSAGFVVQRGSEDIAFPHHVTIEGGVSFGNAREGIVLRMVSDILIDGVLVEQNGAQGIRGQGVTNVEIVGSLIRDNSQLGNGLFDQIIMRYEVDPASGLTFYSTNVLIEDNLIVASGATLPRYGVRMDADGSDLISVLNNRLVGFATAYSIGAVNQTISGNNLTADDAPVTTQALVAAGATEDAAFNYTIPADLFSDPGDTLTLTARLSTGAPLPSWLTFNPTTGVFSGTPGDAGVGAVTVAVVATDSTGLDAVATFTLTVTGVNDAPVLMYPVEDQAVTVGAPVSIAVTADTFIDVDHPGALAFTFELEDGSPLPSWLTYDAVSGNLTGTPPIGAEGELRVVVTATDALGASASDLFVIDILDTNNAPVLNSPLPDGAGRANQAFFYEVPAGAITDADGARTLTYSAKLTNGDDLPSWLVLDTARGSFAGLAPNTTPLDVVITATDAIGVSVSDTVRFTFESERIFNASDYGARANDAVEDTDAIQAAIDAAVSAGGGTVVLGPGTFLVTGGEKPSLGAVMMYSNVTLKGAGMGATSIKVQDGWDGGITGIIRTPYGVETQNVGIFDLTIDGNRDNTAGKIDAFFQGYIPGEPNYTSNIIMQRVEMMDASGYGFDPHEQTQNLFAIDNVSHGHGLDGFVADYIVGALYQGNVAYGNDRHGFNIVTKSSNVALVDNVAYGNGATGITLQRGSQVDNWVTDLTVTGGWVYGNAGEGIVVKMADGIVITGVLSEENGREGIRVMGAENVLIIDNLLRNNSQLGDGIYDQIRVERQVDTISGNDYSSFHVRIEGNRIVADGDILPRYGIRENPVGADFTVLVDNRIIGYSNAPVSIAGSNSSVTGTNTAPDQAPTATQTLAPMALTEDQAFSYTLPAGLFADADPGDAISVLVRQSNGAPLPPWLTYNPVTRTLSGTPPNSAAGPLQLSVVGTDLAGLGVVVALALTVTNVNDAPILLNPTPDRIVDANAPFAINFADAVFLDVDAGDTLTYSARLTNGSALPSWLTINANGTLSGAPTTAHVGTVSVRITARDVAGATATDDVTFTVVTAPIMGTAGPDTLVGTSGPDVIYGLGGNDTINAGAGADIIDGGEGADAMTGGAGSDTYYVDNVGDTIIESSGSSNGTDTVIASVDYTLSNNVEELRLVGAARNGTGNSSNNILHGNDLNNVLDGKGGNDTMTGYGGDDTYVVDSSSDTVIEALNGGYDTVLTSVNHTLAANVEAGTITGTSGRTLTGNALDNVLIGNSGNNKLNGGAGNDILNGGAGSDEMTGGAGNDTFYVDRSGDKVSENSNGGTDTIYTTVNYTLPSNVEILYLIGSAVTGTGNSGDNFIYGNALNNTLNGGSGADTIDGGAGADTINGGNGNDTIIIKPGEANGDRILSFQGANASGGDMLKLVGFGSNVVLTNNGDIWTVTGSLGTATFEIDGVTALSQFDYILG